MLRRLLIALPLLFLALLFVDRASLFIAPCIVEKSNSADKRDEGSDQGCAKREGVVIAGIEAIKEIPPDWWTALATLAIAAFTYILYRATNRQADLTRKAISDAEDTSRRELRAYPGVTGAAITIDSGNIHIAFAVQNLSTTPAYKFRYKLEYEIFQPDPVVGLKEMNTSGMQWDMAPHSTTTMRTGGKVTEAQRVGLCSGAMVLVIWGNADYSDAFDCPRYIKFVYKTSGFRDEVASTYFPGGGIQQRTVHVCPEPDPIDYASN